MKGQGQFALTLVVLSVTAPIGARDAGPASAGTGVSCRAFPAIHVGWRRTAYE
jgi:hypothetical protein